MQDVRLLVLDRDGVINEDSDQYIKSADEWQPIPGSIEAIAKLTGAGFTIAVATNQSGLARGYFDEAALEAMHEKMNTLCAGAGGFIDRIMVCPHGPDGHCDCRKPKPGLLLALGEHYGIDLNNVPVIGDSLRDLQAAQSAGASPILVRSGKGAATERALPADFANIDIYDNLAAAADAIIQQC